VPRAFARLAPEHAGRAAFRVDDDIAEDGGDRLIFIDLVRLIPAAVVGPRREDLEHHDRGRDGDRGPGRRGTGDEGIRLAERATGGFDRILRVVGVAGGSGREPMRIRIGDLAEQGLLSIVMARASIPSPSIALS
jgi:hypothetical protein